MADEKSTKTFGQFAETTKNGVAKYNSGWGTQYVPKAEYDKLGQPERITITLTAEEA
jgi:hypothetical protein